MRSILPKLFIGAAITTIALFGADNSIGTWKRNTEKSTFSTPSTVKNLTMVIEASKNGAKFTATGERTDGTAINGANTVEYDGKDYPATGATWDTVSMRQVDANTFTATSTKKGGKYNVTSRTVISEDGHTMTTTNKGVNNDGKPVESTVVYDKQ